MSADTDKISKLSERVGILHSSTEMESFVEKKSQIMLQNMASSQTQQAALVLLPLR